MQHWRDDLAYAVKTFCLPEKKEGSGIVFDDTSLSVGEALRRVTRNSR